MRPRLRPLVLALVAVLALGGVASAVPLAQLEPWLIVLALAAAGLLALPLAWLLRWLARGLRRQRWRRTWGWTAFTLAAVLLMLGAAPIWGLTWLAEARPLSIPRATLGNGDRTVVFQGMIHAASPAFYDHVRDGIDQALADGYVIYHEGVLPADPESNAWLSSVVPGSGDLGDRQRTLSDICGLQFQRDAFPDLAQEIEARPDRHVRADVTVAEIKREFERLQGSDSARDQLETDVGAPSPIGLGPAQAAQLEAAFERFLAWQAAGSDSRKRIVRSLCAGVMSLFIDEEAMERVPWPLSAVIIDYRDRALAQRIVAAPQPRIYVVYGAGHYRGLVRELQAIDPRWEVRALEAIQLSGVARRVSVMPAVPAQEPAAGLKN